MHVSHESLAWIGPHRAPTANFFLMFYLTALLPELDEEYLWFRDFVLLRDLWPEDARRPSTWRGSRRPPTAAGGSGETPSGGPTTRSRHWAMAA